MQIEFFLLIKFIEHQRYKWYSAFHHVLPLYHSRRINKNVYVVWSNCFRVLLLTLISQYRVSSPIIIQIYIIHLPLISMLIFTFKARCTKLICVTINFLHAFSSEITSAQYDIVCIIWCEDPYVHTQKNYMTILFTSAKLVTYWLNNTSKKST